jgi:hypothetical protein
MMALLILVKDKAKLPWGSDAHLTNGTVERTDASRIKLAG